MDFNSLIFPAPMSSYTPQSLFGNIIYVPKYKQFSISDIQAFRNSYNFAKQVITTPANSQKPKHFCFDNHEAKNYRTTEHDFYEKEFVPCLFLPYEPGSTKVLVYFHGNAEDIGLALPLLDILKNQLKVHIIAIEYPGYGIYEGKPSAEKILEDSDFVMSFIIKMLGIKANDIIIFGRSIGSGPATYIASKYKINSLLLMSPYTSIRAVARNIVGRIGQFLVAERFRNIDYIKLAKSPVMIIHGLKDQLIPYTQSQDLCEQCQVSAKLVLPLNMDHNIFDMEQDLLEPLRGFLERNDFEWKPKDRTKGKLLVPERLFVRPISANFNKETGFFSWLF